MSPVPASRTQTAPAFPIRSTGVLSDLRHFVLKQPDIPTIVEFGTFAQREDTSQRILQRLGVSVWRYRILNEHRIGVNVPVRFAFEELMDWDAGSLCWPNQLARPERIDGSLEHFQFFLLNQRESLLGLRNGFLGVQFIPLFSIDMIRFQMEPDPLFDNARYLLYECSGGYPIGIFYLYVRSSVAAQGETDQTQVFLGVSFNFYGRADWAHARLLGRIWERVHNRVTGNILNRFKQLCEARFHELETGRRLPRPVTGRLSRHPGHPGRTSSNSLR